MSNSADPTTPFLGLTKPIVDDEDGEDLWGEKLNANFDLIDTFAANQGVLTEAPEDGKYYLRGERQWLEGTTQVEHDALDTRVAANTADIDSLQAADAAFPDAPADGYLYVRGGSAGQQTRQWYNMSTTGSISWNNITGKPTYFSTDWNTTVFNKPATFPPTLPITSADVTGLDAKNAEQDGRLTAVETKNTSQDTAINGKEPTIAPGTSAQFWRGDKTWQPLSSITVDAWTKAESDARFVNVTGDTLTGNLTIAATDSVMTLNPPTAGGKGTISLQAGGLNRWDIARTQDAASNFEIRRFDNAGGLFPIDAPLKINRATGVTDFTQTPTVNGSPLIGGAVIADTPPAGAVAGQFWWESDTGALFLRYTDANSSQWVQCNTAGLPEAPMNGGSFARYNGAWVDLATTFDDYLPLSGGTLTGQLNGVGFAFSAYGQNVGNMGSSYAYQGNNSNAGGGGILGYSGGVYGIVGYVGVYGFYTGSPINGGAGTFTTLSCPTCTFNAATTTSSATAYLSTGGGLYRSTSSIAFKTAIEPLEPIYADKVLDLQTLFYRPGENTVDPIDWSRFGFSVENAYETDFRFTACSPAAVRPIMREIPDPEDMTRLIEVPTGEYEMTEHAPPSDIDLKAIVACLLDVVRRQGARIAALEAASGV